MRNKILLQFTFPSWEVSLLLSTRMRLNFLYSSLQIHCRLTLLKFILETKYWQRLQKKYINWLWCRERLRENSLPLLFFLPSILFMLQLSTMNRKYFVIDDFLAHCFLSIWNWFDFESSMQPLNSLMLHELFVILMLLFNCLLFFVWLILVCIKGSNLNFEVCTTYYSIVVLKVKLGTTMLLWFL
jgi:hypothetical protein